MPVMDGIEATQLIRLQPQNVDTVIFGCTADVFKETRQRMLNAGVDDIVAKPIIERDFDELLGLYAKRLFIGAVIFKTDLASSLAQVSLTKINQTLDLHRLMKNINLPRDMAPVFFKTVIEESLTTIISLNDAVKKNDPKSLHFHVHSLKGTWRTLGLWDLVTLGDDIERCIMDNKDVEQALIEGFITQSQRYLDSLTMMIEQEAAS